MEHEYIHPTYLGWQIDWPLFVKRPFSACGKPWKVGEHFNWHTQLGVKDAQIAHLYNSGFVHHCPPRESENRVGDRLGEMSIQQLQSLIRQVNAIVKNTCTSQDEFARKKIKQSKLPDKQRGLVRTWLRNNSWVLEDYYKIRDTILDTEGS
jgi:hypothetical protein